MRVCNRVKGVMVAAVWLLAVWLLAPVQGQTPTENVRKVVATDAITGDLDFLTGRTLTMGSGATFTYSTGASVGGDLTELRADLGLAIDLDVQAYSAVLDSLTGADAAAVDWLLAPSSANLAQAVTDETGTGALVLATSPVLTTPDLGVPSAVDLTNATNIPASELDGLGTNVLTWLTTPNSSNLRAALTDEVGTGALYFVGGALGTPASATLTNATGLPTGGLLNEAVTNAKLAHMAQATIKGRAAGAGTGDVTDLTADQAMAVLATASTPPALSSQVKVRQVVIVTPKTDTATGSNTSPSTVYSGSITPTAADSQIIVLVFGCATNTFGEAAFARIANGSTALQIGDAASSRERAFVNLISHNSNFLALPLTVTGWDAPGSTSAQTYNLQLWCQSGSWYLNRSAADTDNNFNVRGVTQMFLIEVAP